MIGRTNTGGGGGGGGNGFYVVGGTTRPKSAGQNTVWVNTDREITSYVLSASEPKSPTSNMLWLAIKGTGVKSTAPVGSDLIVLYLDSAKQYVSGKWVEKDGYIYQDGVWNELCGGWLYYYGAENSSDITGGVSVGKQTYSTSEKKEDHIYMSATSTTNSSFSHSTCYFNNPIDLSAYKTLRVILNTAKYDSTSGAVKVGISDLAVRFSEPTEQRYTDITGVISTALGDVEIEYDISGVSGLYYVGIINRVNTTKVYAINLE